MPRNMGQLYRPGFEGLDLGLGQLSTTFDCEVQLKPIKLEIPDLLELTPSHDLGLIQVSPGTVKNSSCL